MMIASVKPNWFTSTKLLMGAATGVTYRLTDLDGVPVKSGIEYGKWAETCEIDQWASAFEGCKSKP